MAIATSARTTMRTMSNSVGSVVLGRRQGFHRGAGSTQTSRSQVDHAVNPGPDVEHHFATFASGALHTGSDLLGSLLQPADQCQHVRVVIGRQQISHHDRARAALRAQLLEAVKGAVCVPVGTVETSKYDIGGDLRLKITGRFRCGGSLVGC